MQTPRHRPDHLRTFAAVLALGTLAFATEAPALQDETNAARQILAEAGTTFHNARPTCRAHTVPVAPHRAREPDAHEHRCEQWRRVVATTHGEQLGEAIMWQLLLAARRHAPDANAEQVRTLVENAAEALAETTAERGRELESSLPTHTARRSGPLKTMAHHAMSLSAPAFAPPGARVERHAPAQFRIARRGEADHVTLDADRASAAVALRLLRRGDLAWRDAVRPEEFAHAFEQAVDTPRGEEGERVRTRVESLAPPWRDDEVRLVRLSATGAALDETERERARAITLVLDVSGSMRPHDRTGVLLTGIEAMADALEHTGHGDSVAIATYANEASVALEPTTEPAKVRAALARLRASGAGGGTAGGAGLALARDLARSHGTPDRRTMVLMTDGDFNIGPRDPDALARIAQSLRADGVHLLVVLVGDDNLRDDVAQTLAREGNGEALYVATAAHARRYLATELIEERRRPVARDLKSRFSPNPATVAEYRRIGLADRQSDAAAFADPRTNGGELASGTQASVWYELVPSGTDARHLDEPDYPAVRPDAADTGTELGRWRLRWRETDGSAGEATHEVTGDESASAHTRFLANVLWAGMALARTSHVPVEDLRVIYDAVRRAGEEASLPDARALGTVLDLLWEARFADAPP